MRKWLFIAVLLLALAGGMACAGASPAVDKQSVYQTGQDYAALGMYQNALEQFERIPGYADAGSWRFYCEAMIALSQADDFEAYGYLSDAEACVDQALRYFEILANAGFRDSERLKIYCNARRYELKGLTQSALDLYAGLLDVRDSGDRYLNTLSGKALPTQAPVVEVVLAPSPVPAHITRRVTTYFGPGDSYREQALMPVGAGLAVGVCGRENGYCMIEITASNGKLRAWVPSIRVKRDEDRTEPEVGASPRKARVARATKALYGPGEGYIASPVTLAAGESVTAYEAEGDYTMIEYTDKKIRQPMRLWVPSSELIQ